jgi:hypothetical protein
MHGIVYDDLHDEIMVGNPFAQSVLAFRGGANGEEPPVRVIQGSLTQLGYPDKIALDATHNEIFIPQGDRILVFPRTSTGNVAPIRVLQGPDTRLRGSDKAAPYMAVDPVHNRLLVLRRDAVLVFDRTAQGNAKPLAVISGPKTHLGSGSGGGKIFASPRGDIILIGTGPIDGRVARTEGGAEMPDGSGGFVSVWNMDDNGDVAPRRWRLGLPEGPFYNPENYGSIMGAGIDPKNKSIMVASKALNAVLTYVFPEIF